MGFFKLQGGFEAHPNF
jgi:hypothetical protein